MKVGIEVELVTPRGTSRSDAAEALASAFGSEVKTCFKLAAEPAAKKRSAPLYQLSKGFEVSLGQGRSITLIDDVTLKSDFNTNAVPVPGFHRIVADDLRLLRLVQEQCDAAAPIEEVLTPLASFFSADVQERAGYFHVEDSVGGVIAVVAPQPGERERAMEVVFSPFEIEECEHFFKALGTLKAFGAQLACEGSAHVHLDLTPALQTNTSLRWLIINLASTHSLWRFVLGTNERLRRVGPFPASVLAFVLEDDFLAMPFAVAAERLLELGVTKYCDFNLQHLLLRKALLPTVEMRIARASLDPQETMDAAQLFDRLLAAARGGCRLPSGPPTVTHAAEVLSFLKLPEDVLSRLLVRAETYARTSSCVHPHSFVSVRETATMQRTEEVTKGGFSRVNATNRS